MTTATQLVTDLGTRGVHLSVTTEGRLRYDAPGDIDVDQLVRELREHKTELIEAVTANSCPDHGARVYKTGLRVLYCSRCGYSAPKQATPPELARRALRYPLNYVREKLPTLPAECRDHYEETLDIATEKGWWDEETRERFAFGRMVDEMLAPQGRDL